MIELEPHPARWWTATDGGRFRCDLCPRHCELKPGQRGFCYVRMATAAGLVSTTYGRSSGFCIDPVEKKPLNHFLPGTAILSFGTAGCNLGCSFCQNHDMSTARSNDRLQSRATPEDIAAAAAEHGCHSVAFTYNDPIVFAEYAIDTAAACHARGVRTVAVTNGWMAAGARQDLYAAMDGANIDLKAFTEDFYKRYCKARLAEVLETIEHACNETGCWVELTTLVVPGANDDPAEIDAMTRWVVDHVGPDVPMHFSAFHPDYKLTDRPRTPPSTLESAREIARANGVRFVYTGNVHDPAGGSTWCPDCGALLIERDWYQLGTWGLDGSACAQCGAAIPGVFERGPGSWGRRRLPLRMGQ